MIPMIVETEIGTSASTRNFQNMVLEISTPKKTNMEPENHPFEKEKHLNQTFILGFHANFRGCSVS